MVCPAAKFRFDVDGTVPPAGYAVRKLGADPPVTVTFMTAATAVVGTAAEPPVTVRLRGAAAASFVPHPPVELRESRMRTGDSGWNRDPSLGMTGVVGAVGGLVPALFVAVTVNVYGVP